MSFIPESDLYRLVVHSKLPAAEKFERWVFEEVLPSIRKQGYYSKRDEFPMDKVTEIIQQVAVATAIEVAKQFATSRNTDKIYTDIRVDTPRRRKSFGKVDRLPDTYREAVDQMLEDGFSYREITEFLAQRGHIMSQMAVHTYAMR